MRITQQHIHTHNHCSFSFSRSNIIFIIQNMHSIHCSYRIASHRIVPYPLFIKCILAVRYLHLLSCNTSYCVRRFGSLYIFNRMNGAWCFASAYTRDMYVHMCVLEYHSRSMSRQWYMLNNWAYIYAKQFLSMKKRQSNIDIRTITANSSVRLGSTRRRDLQCVCAPVMMIVIK